MNALKRYELMVIVSPRLTEVEVTSLYGEIKEQLGEIIHEDIWGKRKFAYPIEKYADGLYAVWNFRLPQDQLSGLHDFLRIHQGVLRHLIILVPEDYQPITGKQVEEGLDAYYEALKQGKRGGMRGERPMGQKPSVAVQDKESKEVEKPAVKKAEEPVAVEPEKTEEPVIEEPVQEEAPVVAEPEVKEEPVVVAKPKKVPEKKVEEPEKEVSPAPKPEKKPESPVDSKLDEKLKSIFEDELSF